MTVLLAAAAATDTGVNPLFFVLGGVALVVVSALGPLSRMHERREQLKAEAQQHPKNPSE